MLVPTLTVAENVVLGREPARGPFLDRTAANLRVVSTAARFGLDLDPAALVGELSVGEQQRVEIVKVLDRGARTLVLDEPTAVLTPLEVERFFAILRDLAGAGHAIVLITHRLGEVLSIADEVTVMRAGRVVHKGPVRGTTEADLAAKIVGRELRPPARKRAANPGPVVLELVRASTAGGRAALHEVSLQVRAGEILGLPASKATGSGRSRTRCSGSNRSSAGKCGSAATIWPRSTALPGARPESPGCPRTGSGRRSLPRCGSKRTSFSASNAIRRWVRMVGSTPSGCARVPWRCSRTPKCAPRTHVCRLQRSRAAINRSWYWHASWPARRACWCSGSRRAVSMSRHRVPACAHLAARDAGQAVLLVSRT